MTLVMSMVWSPTGILLGLSRLVPRMVPPTVRMPESAGPERRTVRSCISPRNPSRKPMICMPYAPMPALPTPRMAALSPGLSPPAVRMPTNWVMGGSRFVLVDDYSCTRRFRMPAIVRQSMCGDQHVEQ